MKENSEELLFIINLGKVQSRVVRKMDIRLSAYGLGFSDFIILYHLNTARGKKMRRIDLSDAIGLTASGVTRMLAPMEKYGLISRESNERDARVSYVVLTESGSRILQEAMSSAVHVAETLFPIKKNKEMTRLNKALEEMIFITL